MEFITDCFLSAECIVITVLLFWLYNAKRISAIEFIFYGNATTTFYVAFVSTTITPLFFINIFFVISEGAALFQNKMRLSMPVLMMIFLPLVSTFVMSAFIMLGYDVFEGFTPSIARVLYDGAFFYFKYFLPMIFLGTKIYREAGTYDVEYFFLVIRRVAIVSCYIALAQLFITFIIKDEMLLRLIGLKTQYLEFTTNGVENSTARVSAFFWEPKTLSSFLVIAFPLFLRDRKYLSLVLILVVGILTASQTFTLGIIINIIVFIVLKRIRSIRANIAIVLVAILLTFNSVFLAKQLIFDFYMSHSDNYVVNLVVARAIERYDVNSADAESNQVAGLPLQKDSDLPVFNFFRNKPWLYLTGYGLKNQGFIPVSYFIYNHEGARQIGMMSYNIDLRWYYFVCEFGLIAFLVWLSYFTKPFDQTVINTYQSKYYGFLIAFLFFNGIELIVILVYAFYSGKIFYINSKNNLRIDQNTQPKIKPLS